MPNITGFIAKKEMNKVPIIRVWMRYLYCLLLDRQNPKEGLKTILKGIEYLKMESPLLYFLREHAMIVMVFLKFHGEVLNLQKKQLQNYSYGTK